MTHPPKYHSANFWHQCLKLLPLFFLGIAPTLAFGQATTPNPQSLHLLYDSATITGLRAMVDSVHAQPLGDWADFQPAQSQTRAHWIRITGKKAPKALSALESGISFEEFEANFPKATIEKNLLVICEVEVYNSEKSMIHLKSVELVKGEGQRYFKREHPTGYSYPSVKGRWVFEDIPSWSSPIIEGFFFLEEFETPLLPSPYQDWMAYTHQITDSTTSLFTPWQKTFAEAWGAHIRPPAIKKFVSFLDSATSRPSYLGSGKDWTEYRKDVQAWEPRRDSILDASLGHSPRFKALLDSAVAVAIKVHKSNLELEYYAGRYLNPDLQLQLIRSRPPGANTPYGMTSWEGMVQVTAQLAAETGNWGLFIHAHLDILDKNVGYLKSDNQRSNRETYVRELELIGIKVPELLIGLCLNQEGLPNYYRQPDMATLGIALGETENPNRVTTMLIGAISDPQLDLYNRVKMYTLFMRFNEEIEDREQQAANYDRLSEALKTLPSALAQNLD